ncbi:MAG: hypothetical protein FWF60_00680 [Oscillospiraceae bacterium]|nr:hypothetical protein [Oscillospiraceae bacterium]
MKRMLIALAALLLLAGCGAAGTETPVTTAAEAATTTQAATTIVPTEDIHWVASDYYPARAADNERFPLYVELPEDDIQLYGVNGENYHGDMVLFHEGRETTFSGWGFSKYDLPCIAYYDFDGNGVKDIGVITLVSGGTFTYLTDLHIVTIEKIDTGFIVNDGPYYEYEYADHAFTCEDAAAFLGKGLQAKQGKKKDEIELSYAGKAWTVAIDPGLHWTEEDGVIITQDGYGPGEVSFTFEKKGIKLHTTLFVLCEGHAPVDLPAGFTADVVFDGKQIRLTNIDFQVHQEN